MNLKKAEPNEGPWQPPTPRPALSVAEPGGRSSEAASGGARKLQAELEMAFGPAPEPHVVKWPGGVLVQDVLAEVVGQDQP